MIWHNLTVNFVRPAIQEVSRVSLWNLYLMLITSYIIRTQNVELFYLVVFEILIPKFRNVFIESPDIYIYISTLAKLLSRLILCHITILFSFSVELFCFFLCCSILLHFTVFQLSTIVKATRALTDIANQNKLGTRALVKKDMKENIVKQVNL